MKLYKDKLGQVREYPSGKIVGSDKIDPAFMRREHEAALAKVKQPQTRQPARIILEPAQKLKIIDAELKRIKLRTAAIAMARQRRIRSGQLTVFTQSETQEMAKMLKLARSLKHRQREMTALAFQVRRYLKTPLMNTRQASSIATFLRAWGTTDEQLKRYDAQRHFIARVQVALFKKQAAQRRARW